MIEIMDSSSAKLRKLVMGPKSRASLMWLLYLVSPINDYFVKKVNINNDFCIIVPPGPPLITPLNPVAKEGEPFELTCSSQGGSPDPLIQWYRDNIPLQGQVSKGGTRDKPTSNTLAIEPSLELDRAIYRCTVWNRATREDKKLEAVVSLTVHCMNSIN